MGYTRPFIVGSKVRLRVHSLGPGLHSYFSENLKRFNYLKNTEEGGCIWWWFSYWLHATHGGKWFPVSIFSFLADRRISDMMIWGKGEHIQFVSELSRLMSMLLQRLFQCEKIDFWVKYRRREDILSELSIFLKIFKEIWYQGHTINVSV